MRQLLTPEGSLDAIKRLSASATQRLIQQRLRDGPEASARPNSSTIQGESGLAPQIRCREINETDIAGMVDLLTNGFHARRQEFWACALGRLTEHPTPSGFPKYGYLLECNGVPVGVILLIFSTVIDNSEPKIRCSVSSWYIAPAFRGYAPMLISRALKFKELTYLNITPDPRTYPILEAQGYVRYCAGSFIAIPALSSRPDKTQISLIAPSTLAVEGLQSWEVDLLRRHAGYGCLSLTCRSADRVYPFVFLTYHRFGAVPWAYLAYCRHVDDFVRFAQPLGIFLARHRIMLVELDSNGPINDLVGRYFEGASKYFKGPDRPRLGDIAYSERVMFGF